MINKLTLVFIFLFSISPIIGQEYFEGEIHYKVSYTPLIDQLSENRIIQTLGDTIIGYVQERRYIMESNTTDSYGRIKLIMLMDENLVYMVPEKTDTIYKYALNKENSKLLEARKNKGDIKTILGDKCSSVTLITSDLSLNPLDKTTGIYYYNPKYKLNKEVYSIHKQNHWNQFVNIAGAISVRNEVTREPFYKSVMTAYQIIPKKIPDHLFKIDTKGKIVKEIK